MSLHQPPLARCSRCFQRCPTVRVVAFNHRSHAAVTQPRSRAMARLPASAHTPFGFPSAQWLAEGGWLVAALVGTSQTSELVQNCSLHSNHRSRAAVTALSHRARAVIVAFSHGPPHAAVAAFNHPLTCLSRCTELLPHPPRSIPSAVGATRHARCISHRCRARAGLAPTPHQLRPATTLTRLSQRTGSIPRAGSSRRLHASGRAVRRNIKNRRAPTC